MFRLVDAGDDDGCSNAKIAIGFFIRIYLILFLKNIKCALFDPYFKKFKIVLADRSRNDEGDVALRR